MDFELRSVCLLLHFFTSRPIIGDCITTLNDFECITTLHDFDCINTLHDFAQLFGVDMLLLQTVYTCCYVINPLFRS